MISEILERLLRRVGAEAATPFNQVILKLMRKPCVTISEQLQVACFRSANVGFEIPHDVFTT
jgi:hypothetical protein